MKTENQHPNTAVILSIEGINKWFGSVIACDNVSLSVRRNEFFFIVGPSGCGKTTLLRLIAGLLEPDSGSIFLNGHSLAAIPAYKRDINTVFQNYALFPHLTIFDNIAFGLRMKNEFKSTIDEKVEEILNLVQLKGLERRKPSQLSGGQQQRVALARALVNKPAVLLLDEPLGALDVRLRKQMQDELRRLQSKLGITFVYVTHDQEEALTMADQIAVMSCGHIEQVGTPQEIYISPKSRFVAEFIGESNFFESSNVSVRNKLVAMRISDSDTIFAPQTTGFNSKDKLTFSVRPERIQIHRGLYTQVGLRNCLVGHVEEVIYRGTTLEYRIRVSSGQVISVLEQNYGGIPEYSSGNAVAIEWDISNTVLLIE